MIPKNLEKPHFSRAAREIDRTGIPARRESTRYELVIAGKRYPPKLVISLAAKIVSGKELAAKVFNAVEAKNYFIRRGFKVLDKSRNELLAKVVEEDELSEFPEGEANYRQHIHRERDTALARRAKAVRFAKTGDLRCDVCDFSFIKKYGALGFGYIEAHHTIPISQLDGKRKTKMSELALVCSNCHRMFHHGRTWLSIAELRKIIGQSRNVGRGPKLRLKSASEDR
jgi:predicted HNH restriction endonuclease